MASSRIEDELQALAHVFPWLSISAEDPIKPSQPLRVPQNTKHCNTAPPSVLGKRRRSFLAPSNPASLLDTQGVSLSASKSYMYRFRGNDDTLLEISRIASLQDGINERRPRDGDVEGSQPYPAKKWRITGGYSTRRGGYYDTMEDLIFGLEWEAESRRLQEEYTRRLEQKQGLREK